MKHELLKKIAKEGVKRHKKSGNKEYPSSHHYRPTSVVRALTAKKHKGFEPTSERDAETRETSHYKPWMH